MEQQPEQQYDIYTLMDQIKVRGLTSEQILLLFNGESEVSTREALLVSHIQFLETRLEFMFTAIEEIASLTSGAGSEIAKKVLDTLAPSREIKGAEDVEQQADREQS